MTHLEHWRGFYRKFYYPKLEVEIVKTCGVCQRLGGVHWKIKLVCKKCKRDIIFHGIEAEVVKLQSGERIEKCTRCGGEWVPVT